jgi:TRAP-type mannitol/chloroaromatic compound transport system substrate-binding protein
LNNARALRELRAGGRVRIENFSEDLLARFSALSTEVIGEITAADAVAARIAESYYAYRLLARDWHGVAEGALAGGAK